MKHWSGIWVWMTARGIYYISQFIPWYKTHQLYFSKLNLKINISTTNIVFRQLHKNKYQTLKINWLLLRPGFIIISNHIYSSYTNFYILKFKFNAFSVQLSWMTHKHVSSTGKIKCNNTILQCPCYICTYCSNIYTVVITIVLT